MASEVSASSDGIDLGAKKRAYRRNGVREYVVWRVLDKAVDWFLLRNNKYKVLAKIKGIFHSEVFPGLWLDAAALLRGDMRRVYDVLLEGLASPEHQAFVEKLNSRR